MNFSEACNPFAFLSWGFTNTLSESFRKVIPQACTSSLAYISHIIAGEWVNIYIEIKLSKKSMRVSEANFCNVMRGHGFNIWKIYEIWDHPNSDVCTNECGSRSVSIFSFGGFLPILFYSNTLEKFSVWFVFILDLI